jgi:tRNA 2-thiouridine synthesizing protein A
MTDTVLDARGLICPMPVLKARRALKPLPTGAQLVVLATDAAALRDMPDFCAVTGHRLVSVSSDAEGLHTFLIEKGPSQS